MTDRQKFKGPIQVTDELVGDLRLMTDRRPAGGDASAGAGLDRIRDEIADKLWVVFNGSNEGSTHRQIVRQQCEDFLVDLFGEAVLKEHKAAYSRIFLLTQIRRAVSQAFMIATTDPKYHGQLSREVAAHELFIELGAKTLPPGNWHNIEGPNGRCACGPREACGTVLRRWLGLEQEQEVAARPETDYED